MTVRAGDVETALVALMCPAAVTVDADGVTSSRLTVMDWRMNAATTLVSCVRVAQTSSPTLEEIVIVLKVHVDPPLQAL